jgi:hypothetical protein
MRRARTGMPLWLAITLALVVKLIILMALHKAFFAAPQAKKMRMPTTSVEQHLLGSPAPQPVAKAQP